MNNCCDVYAAWKRAAILNKGKITSLDEAQLAMNQKTVKTLESLEFNTETIGIRERSAEIRSNTKPKPSKGKHRRNRYAKLF